MASSVRAFHILCIFLCICSLQTVVMASPDTLQLTFYTYEVQSGPNSTVLLAAGTGQGGNFSNLGWGSFVTFDNIIRDGVSSNSTLLGQITGYSVVTSIAKHGESGYASLFTGQFIFNYGEYKNSSLTVLPGGVVEGASGYFKGYSGFGETVDDFTAENGGHVYQWDFDLTKVF